MRPATIGVEHFARLFSRCSPSARRASHPYGLATFLVCVDVLLIVE
jgi:hypothetical protein